jgi:hypothetical protein
MICFFDQEVWLSDPGYAGNVCANKVWFFDPWPQIGVCATQNTPENINVFLKMREKTLLTNPNYCMKLNFHLLLHQIIIIFYTHLNCVNFYLHSTFNLFKFSSQILGLQSIINTIIALKLVSYGQFVINIR